MSNGRLGVEPMPRITSPEAARDAAHVARVVVGIRGRCRRRHCAAHSRRRAVRARPPTSAGERRGHLRSRPGHSAWAVIARGAGLDIGLTTASRSEPGRAGLNCRGASVNGPAI